MKRVKFIAILFLCFGCEDVIDVDLPDTEKRIIVDGVLKFNADNPRRNVIRISEVTSFFEDNIPATLDRVQLLNETQGGVGFYIPNPEDPSEFIPGAEGVPSNQQLLLPLPDDFSDRVILTFEINEELFLAEYRYSRAPEITSVSQEMDTSLDDDEFKVTISFNDIPEEENFYIFDFGEGELFTLEDRFFKDQEYTFSYVFKRNIQSGETIEMNVRGADRQLFNFTNLLIEQSELGTFGLFQTPVATARGNILKVEGINNIDLFDNVGRPQDFVLGYFALVQENTFYLTKQ